MEIDTIWPGRVARFTDRAAWEASRFEGDRIGASDAPAVFGLSPWSGPWDLWARMVRGVRPERTDAEKEVLARGLRFEVTVAREYAHARPQSRVIHLGAEDGCVVRHADHPWAVCSPDAIAFEGDGWGIAEFKTAMRADGWSSEDLDALDLELAEGAVPQVYLLQCLWQLYVTGAAWVDLVVLLPRYELRIVRIHRDEEAIAGLARKVAAWRERHIIGGEEPDPMLSDEVKRRAARQERADSKAKPLPADPEIAVMIDAAVDLRDAAKAAEAEYDDARDRLLKLATDGAKGWTTGRHTATIVRSERTTLDTKALAAAYPDLDLTPYQRTTKSAHILLTSKKEK